MRKKDRRDRKYLTPDPARKASKYPGLAEVKERKEGR